MRSAGQREKRVWLLYGKWENTCGRGGKEERNRQWGDGKENKFCQLLDFAASINLKRSPKKKLLVDHSLVIKKCVHFSPQNIVVKIHLFSKGTINVLILLLKSVWSANLILHDKILPNRKIWNINPWLYWKCFGMQMLLILPLYFN